MKLRTSYALHEGGERDFAITTTRFSGNGHVQEIEWVQNSGAPPFAPIAGTEESRPAELVLLAMGFLGPEQALLEQLGVERDARTNADAPAYATSAEGVFAAGDARRGQSLIVWAIDEGRKCASEVDAGYARVTITDGRSTAAARARARTPRDRAPARRATRSRARTEARAARAAREPHAPCRCQIEASGRSRTRRT